VVRRDTMALDSASGRGGVPAGARRLTTPAFEGSLSSRQALRTTRRGQPGRARAQCRIDLIARTSTAAGFAPVKARGASVAQ